MKSVYWQIYRLFIYSLSMLLFNSQLVLSFLRERERGRERERETLWISFVCFQIWCIHYSRYNKLHSRYWNKLIYVRLVGRNFQRGGGGGVSRQASRVAHLAAGSLGALSDPRSPGVFGAKSFNLAISRHFIQTFRKSRFSIFKFYTNKDFVT